MSALAASAFRRRLGGVLLTLTLALTPAWTQGPARAEAAVEAAATPVSITAVHAVGVTVSDLDRAVDFYTRVLDFEREAEWEEMGEPLEHFTGVFGAHTRTARLRLGDERIELTEFLAPRGRPIPVDRKSNDRSFQHVAIIVSDMDRAYRRLREHGVKHVSTAPQRLPDWNPNAGGIEAFYFEDPDGHVLEVLEFPRGKGAAKWHRDSNRLFLGIDHTAIVVADTETSLGFYRDVLGLRVAGESENYGPEQERLNQVFGARLRITALRAPEGPGIEFLEYLSPGDGRPAPSDLRANDLLHWQTLLATPDVAAGAARLRAARAPLVSSGATELSGSKSSYRDGVLVRDPDGHAIGLVATDGNLAGRKTP